MQNKMTREQAIEIVGEAAVNFIEGKNCEPTNRVGFNGACQGDDLCEWSAELRCPDMGANQVKLVAYYYTTNEQDQLVAECDGDGSVIDWEIDHYEVI